MIAYAGEWHDEVPGLMGNQVERVVMKNIRGRYHVDMNLYKYVCIMPMFML